MSKKICSYEYFDSLLKAKNITAYKVAKDTGVTTATLTSWKQGKYTPKPDKLRKIADYLGVSLEYLETGKETKSKAFSTDTALLLADLQFNEQFLQIAKMYKELSADRQDDIMDIVKIFYEKEKR